MRAKAQPLRPGHFFLIEELEAFKRIKELLFFLNQLLNCCELRLCLLDQQLYSGFNFLPIFNYITSKNHYLLLKARYFVVATENKIDKFLPFLVGGQSGQ